MNSIKMSDEVWYFENAVDEADELLESLTEWEKNANQEYMDYAHLSTKDYLDITDNAIFKCLDVWYNNHLTLDPSKYKVAKRTYVHKRGPGPGYGPHTDFAKMPDDTYEQVTATILAYLCDEEGFEGGEIYFPDYDVTIKPKKGSVIIFGDTVRHGVNDVLSGQRAIASTFLIKNKYFYKEMGAVNPKAPTAEEERKFWLQVPQYEVKNGNAIVSQFAKEED
jgi:hypothetical protein